MFDKFEHIVIMTLDKRLEKGDSNILNEIKARKGNPTRFLVGDGQLYPTSWYGHIDIDAKPRKQALNYSWGLHKIIRQAKYYGIKKFLYLEDDAKLTNKFDIIFPKVINKILGLYEWDMFYLGGNHKNGEIKKIEGEENIIFPSYTLDLHAVIFNETCYDKILSIGVSAEHTIDGVIGAMQRDNIFTVMAVSPSIIVQKPGWSYNEGRHDDKTDRYDI